MLNDGYLGLLIICYNILGLNLGLGYLLVVWIAVALDGGFNW